MESKEFKDVANLIIVSSRSSYDTISFVNILNFSIERGDYSIMQATIREYDVYCRF